MVECRLYDKPGRIYRSGVFPPPSASSTIYTPSSIDTYTLYIYTLIMLPSRQFSLPNRRIASLLLHRHKIPSRSSSTSTSASSIASSFLSKFQSLGPQSRTQTLDANQLHLLSLTLNRPSLFPSSPDLSTANAAPPSPETPLPPGYHLVYFTPAFLENDLGADGTDTSYNPSEPFTRRMWAGGEVSWPRGKDGRPNPLRVGQEVTETTKVLSAEPKVVKKTGEDMIVVGVEKEFKNGEGIAVVDRRYVLRIYPYMRAERGECKFDGLLTV